MPVHTIQPSFAGGEFAPSLYGRVDLQKYSIGCKTVRNFIIHKHGGASNRPGTKFIAETKYSNKKARLVPFEFSTVQAYVIEFGDKYCRFYMNGAQILDENDDPYEIQTPYSAEDLFLLKFAQSADVLYIVHPNYHPRVLIRYGHDNWELRLFENQNGPFMMANIDTESTITASGVTGDVTLTATKDIFHEGQVGGLFKISHFQEGQAASGSFSSTGVSATIKVYSVWRLITHGTWTGKIRLEQSFDNGTTWKAMRTYSSNDDYNVTTSDTINTPCLLRLNCFSHSSGTISYDLTADPYEHDGIVKITGVTDSKTAAATVLKELASTAATDNWAEGAWSDYRGYPSCVTFYFDRLLFGGTYAEPQTFWASQTGDYTNFGTSFPLADTDAITLTLLSRKVNKIQNMVDIGELIVLTSNAEWKITPTNGIFSPISLPNAQCQSYGGSSAVEPVVIGSRAIYAQPMRTSIKDIGYSFETDSYLGDEISIFANHLLQNNVVVEMAYQQEPDSIIWIVRDDGVLLGVTYLREQQVLAWHRHDTDGQFESICTIPGTSHNELWTIVKRGDKRFVELFAERPVSDDVMDYFLVDCGLTYEGEPVTEVYGLDHLEGKEVAVIADGNVLPRKTVTDGSIVLDYPAKKVHVGLPYVSEFSPLNIEFQTNTGTLQGKKIKVARAVIRFEKSRGGWLGTDPDRLTEFIQRTSAGEHIPLKSYDHEMPLQSGYKAGNSVFFRQVDPLPVTILAVIMKVDVGG